MHFGGYEVVSSYEDSSIVVVPVPYDETSTYIKGADKGPDAILEASPNLEYYDIETRYEARRHGIFTVDPVTEKVPLKPFQQLSKKKSDIFLVRKNSPWLSEEIIL